MTRKTGSAIFVGFRRVVRGLEERSAQVGVDEFARGQQIRADRCSPGTACLRWSAGGVRLLRVEGLAGVAFGEAVMLDADEATELSGCIRGSDRS